MSRSKKKRIDNRLVEKSPNSKAIDSDRKGRRTGFIIAGLVVVVIAIVVGIFYYQENVAPFHRAIITVDDTTIDMGYFLKRTRLAGADPLTMFDVLTNEQVIKLGASRYVGEVGPEDVDQGLRIIASGGSESASDITEAEFKEWYRQRRNESGLSDSEFREYVAISLLAARLHEYLAERMPTVAEQVHLHTIMLETYEDAVKVRTRWESGEDFANLAHEVSLDEQSKENGGDIGWFPRGVLVPELEYTAFDLSTDNVSEPIPYTSDDTSSTEAVYVYYLFMVSEKADAREVDEEYLPAVADRAFQDWLLAEKASHEIKYNFNSEINAWLNWQLSKNEPTSSTSQQQTQQ